MPFIPLSLYIHLPWCIKKCPYCDFNSHDKAQGFDEDRYLQALLKDLHTSCQRYRDASLPLRPATSIFFGGGTPSLFSAASFEKILDTCGRYFSIEQTEITLEANPGTFEQKRFAAYRAVGINRLSIGIQSFDNKHLHALGRVHNAQQAKQAIRTAQQAGFTNINLDLMYGLPGQTLTEARNDVATACEYEVNHLSHYQLTIEPNTLFHHHPPALPDTDYLWEMQTACQHDLASHHYQQYEISAYARTDQHSRHNLNYWTFGDYLGIGAGAHGKTSQCDHDGNIQQIQRHWKTRQPEAYMQQALQGDAISGSQTLDADTIIFEFLLNALRLKHGCSIKTFRQHTGHDYPALLDFCKSVPDELLLITPEKVVATERGYLFLNSILEQLLPEQNRSVTFTEN